MGQYVLGRRYKVLPDGNFVDLSYIESVFFQTLWPGGTVCPRSSDPVYILSYYMKWVSASWTDGILEGNTRQDLLSKIMNFMRAKGFLFGN